MSTSSASHVDDETRKGDVTDARPKVPPPESANERQTRRLILLSFWAVVILLGLPLWIWTTTVYRADLPSQSMTDWSDGRACQLGYPLRINLDSTSLPESETATFLAAVSDALQRPSSSSLHTYQVTAGSSHNNADLVIGLNLSQDAATPHAKLSGVGRQLDVVCKDQSVACAIFVAQQILDTFADERAAITFALRNTAYGQQVSSEDAAAASIMPELEQRSIRAFKYASTYHLTFSLFAASASPSAWEIDRALQRYIDPLIDALSTISNFTVDTQVQLFSSTSPSIAGPHFDSETQSWMLSQSDLSGFINAAEWPLSPSINGGATINFALYVPSSDRTPLVVANSNKNSWIIPQWGGVQILNRSPSAGNNIDVAELEQIMYTFADQLTALVGLPRRPAPLQLRIDSLTRERLTDLILSASSTLGALDKLTKKLGSIAIPVSVAQSVSTTISELDHACRSLNAGRFQEALEHARTAEDAAEHAFFEPSMVGQVYFPDEHKVAVYVPLLGPMAVPLLMATLKEFKDWRTKKVKTS